MLISTFPRQIFSHRRLVRTKQEMEELLSLYNGKKHLYYSIYSCNEQGEFGEAVIDKIFFDFDGEKALADTKKLVTYCLKEGYRFCILFSGKKGFHVYIFTLPVRQKFLLRNAHKYFDKLLGINNDPHIAGDIARIGRLPNTFHVTGGKYCIPLRVKDLELGLQHIYKKAAHVQKEFCIYGSKLLDLQALPKVATEYAEEELKNVEVVDILLSPVQEEIMVSAMLPCVKSWLMEYEQATHKHRFLFALAGRDMGLTASEVNALAKSYYGKMKERNGIRSRYQEFQAERVLRTAFSKSFIIPTCDSLIESGACPGKCKHYTKNNFPLYKK